jgi:hypothetical protein
VLETFSSPQELFDKKGLFLVFFYGQKYNSSSSSSLPNSYRMITFPLPVLGKVKSYYNINNIKNPSKINDRDPKSKNSYLDAYIDLIYPKDLNTISLQNSSIPITILKDFYTKPNFNLKNLSSRNPYQSNYGNFYRPYQQIASFSNSLISNTTLSFEDN